MITGGEAVYRVLRDNGVRTVFGLLGGSMLELYDAMHADGAIRYIGARDERAAGHMADAYARITGVVGLDALIGGMQEAVPSYRRQHLENNEKALRAGFDAAPAAVAPVWGNAA